MFIKVFIVQCKSTGQFMTNNIHYTHNLNRVGYFQDHQSALDTAVNELDNDFEIYHFYKKDSDLPALHGGGLYAPPM